MRKITILALLILVVGRATKIQDLLMSEDKEYVGTIKLGMTGQAEIVTERKSLLAILLKKIRKTISLD